MSLVFPDVSEVEWLKRALYSDAGAEDMTLKLYQNDITPAESDTASTYTVCDFTGYADKTLTSSQSGSTWAVPTTSSGTTSSQYGTNQTWTGGTGANQDAYGIFAIFATSSVLAFAERFASTRLITEGDTLTVTPVLEMA